MKKFIYYFLLFFIYSVVGYISECIYCSIKDKKIVLNRGFLIGPYLPIYGWGAVAIIVLLDKYKTDFFALFIMTCLVSTVLEYLTSYLMEKIFKARWWDYSDNKFNINGRVCLENSFLFGIGGVLVTYLINPFFTNILNSMNYYVLMIVGVFLLVVYTIDTFISVQTIYKLRVSSTSIKKDLTDEIKQQVAKKLGKNKYFKRRLLNAFPNVKNLTVYNGIKEIIDNINQKK
ncbi:MAG: putative ABC transporter permease [bacterium]|nr:putative ABC transporter permease [bacterium]